ncbi:hypothetical protein dsx2_3401 [Desulfovibrio sp. X2]|uniref:hypothetical protein n=1 Tax=Desulfovibrio sp. X2 TaxID=941449 RepID=UPI000358C382|nr:hypothetical protein [Desulfovibrio sp. X2]EPR39348.1 hypothetical protein dsx2_3401 [Desulfovibrio sp. X2]
MPFSSADALIAANALPLSFNLVLSLAAIGLPLTEGVNELLARSRGQVFIKKCARQTTPLGLVLALYSLLVCGGAAYMVVARTGGGELVSRFALPVLLPLACWLVFSALHALTWDKLKGAPLAHAWLGILSGLCGLVGVHSVAALIRASLAPVHAAGSEMPTLAQQLLPPTGAAHWPLLAQFVLLAPAAAGALSLLWLLFRRHRDDWGRDYYTFAMRLCARWAGVFLLFSILVQVWLVLSLRVLPPASLMRPEQAGPWIAGQILGLVAAWLLLRLSKSETPLRGKAEVAGALLCLWLMAAGTVFAVLKFLLVSF